MTSCYACTGPAVEDCIQECGKGQFKDDLGDCSCMAGHYEISVSKGTPAVTTQECPACPEGCSECKLNDND
jgi:hypothetical protein